MVLFSCIQMEEINGKMKIRKQVYMDLAISLANATPDQQKTVSKYVKKKLSKYVLFNFITIYLSLCFCCVILLRNEI